MGLTALHLAALNGHALVAKLLISSHADTKCTDTKGRTLVRTLSVGTAAHTVTTGRTDVVVEEGLKKNR